MAGTTVILITKQNLGTTGPGDEPFGLEMLDRLLHTLEARVQDIAAICFYTEGVRLLCDSSSLLPSLKLLHGLGARMVACQTCLDHYGLTDRLAVGEIGGMGEIVRLMMEAEKVVTV
jgi:hypothetical protein